MRKFLAVVKREYLKLVWAKAFIVGTLLAPLMSIGFMVVPALIFSIEGEALRVGVVDQSGKMFAPVSAALLNAPDDDEDADFGASSSQTQKPPKSAAARFLVEEIKPENKSLEHIKRELNGRLRDENLDVYVVIPKDFENAEYELFARNSADFITRERIERAVNEAVREARMSEAKLSREKLNEINREVKFKARGVSETGEQQENSGASFALVFVVGFMIYLVLIMYGQTILAAVVEEKETRIAEILFSSARPFTLMMGKLVGVGLAALTQLAIWVSSAAALAIFGINQLQQSGLEFSFPNLSPFFILGLFVFFLLGFFTYATIYALIGSMVTTVQEGGQFSFPPIMLLLLALYSAFPVIRSPNSDFAFWLSIAPFVSPIVMPVRMAVQMPAAWEILLAIIFNSAAVAGLTWLAARVYRIGMLMYGKKATIPEVLRWIRQA